MATPRPRQAAPTPSPAQVFAARHAGLEQRSTEDIFRVTKEQPNSPDNQGTITHNRPSRVAMFKPTATGYIQRQVPVTHIAMNLTNGWLVHCPYCGGGAGDVPLCGPGPNDCPGRPKRHLRVCPIPSCRKRIYDHLPGEEGLERDASNPADPMEIQDEDFATTPAQRTRALLQAHLLTFHPQEARMYHLAAPDPRAGMQPTVRLPEETARGV